MQLFRGTAKLLSVWPTKPSLLLSKGWKYRGKRYRLTQGTYRWYVWPGIGPKADSKYGPLLGTSSFAIVR